MADQQKSRWTWEVPGFEPRKSVEDPKPVSPLARRYSISTPSIAPRAELAKHSVAKSLSLVDLPGSECLLVEDASGDHVKDFLHVFKSLSALGDVLSSLTSKKETVPYEKSMLTKILSDSLGNKSLHKMPVHHLVKTSFALIIDGSYRQMIHGRSFMRERRKFLIESKKWENSMLAEKLNTEKEQNNQLRSQLAHLFQVEQEQKILIQDRDSTIKSLQVPALTLNTLVSSTGLRLAMQEPSSCSFLWVYFLLFVFGGWLALVLHSLQTLML